MPYLLTMDNQVIKIKLTELAVINRVLDEGKDIVFSDSRGRIARANFKRIQFEGHGESGPHIAQKSDFQRASQILEDGRPQNKKEIEKTKAQIREKLTTISPDEIKKQEYLAQTKQYKENNLQLTAMQKQQALDN